MELWEAVVICGIMRSSVERKTSRTYRHLVTEFVDSDHRNYNVTFAGRADPIRVVECFRRSGVRRWRRWLSRRFHPFILGVHDHPRHYRLGIIRRKAVRAFPKQKPSVEALPRHSFLQTTSAPGGYGYLLAEVTLVLRSWRDKKRQQLGTSSVPRSTTFAA